MMLVPQLRWGSFLLWHRKTWFVCCIFSRDSNIFHPGNIMNDLSFFLFNAGYVKRRKPIKHNTVRYMNKTLVWLHMMGPHDGNKEPTSCKYLFLSYFRGPFVASPGLRPAHLFWKLPFVACSQLNWQDQCSFWLFLLINMCQLLTVSLVDPGGASFYFQSVLKGRSIVDQTTSSWGIHWWEISLLAVGHCLAQQQHLTYGLVVFCLLLSSVSVFYYVASKSVFPFSCRWMYYIWNLMRSSVKYFKRWQPFFVRCYMHTVLYTG